MFLIVYHFFNLKTSTSTRTSTLPQIAVLYCKKHTLPIAGGYLCYFLHKKEALPSNQARLVFLLWANYLESRIVATVSSAKPGLPKQRKLSTGSVRRSPISGLAGAKVLVHLSEASLSSQQKLCSGQSPMDQTLLHHIDLTHTLLQSAALCTRSPNEHAGSSDFCPAAWSHRR